MPNLYLAPAESDPVGISRSCLILLKLEWLGYRGNTLSRFHIIPERNGQTARRTNRIALSSRVSVLTRDNVVSLVTIVHLK